MENENTSNGILKIMHHMHAYVPGHSSEHPTTIISAGDLLTCERESNCIEQQRNSSTPSQRLEGLMPVIADFHAIANFYQVFYVINLNIYVHVGKLSKWQHLLHFVILSAKKV